MSPRPRNRADDTYARSRGVARGCIKTLLLHNGVRVEIARHGRLAGDVGVALALHLDRASVPREDGKVKSSELVAARLGKLSAKYLCAALSHLHAVLGPAERRRHRRGFYREAARRG